MSKEIYYRADFKRYEPPRSNPKYSFKGYFKLSYYTTGKTVFIASHDPEGYKHCELMDDGCLKVVFNDHKLDPGRLMCRNEYYSSDQDFADKICDAHFITPTEIFLSETGVASGESNMGNDCVDSAFEGDQIPPCVGSNLKLYFRMSEEDGVKLSDSDCDFELKYYTRSIEECVTIKKEDAVKESDNKYTFVIATRDLSEGALRCLATVTSAKLGTTIIKEIITGVTLAPLPL